MLDFTQVSPLITSLIQVYLYLWDKAQGPLLSRFSPLALVENLPLFGVLMLKHTSNWEFRLETTDKIR